MRGGKRANAGRKPGKKEPQTLEKERVLSALKQRIMKVADKVLDSQLMLANGQQFLYKIEKDEVVGPKGGKSYHAKKPELVIDELEIRNYVENLAENEGVYTLEDPNDRSATYYFITTKEPNNTAIDSMLNRAFGKPAQPIEGGDSSKPIIIQVATEIAAQNGIKTK